MTNDWPEFDPDGEYADCNKPTKQRRNPLKVRNPDRFALALLVAFLLVSALILALREHGG